VYSPVPTPLERVVPSTSEVGSINAQFRLKGYALPPGTTVAAQSWSVHRDPSVFSYPDTFIPDRWLETTSPDNSEQLAKMQQHLMPFGLGSRVCVGQSLAMIVLRVAIAVIVRNFDIVAPEETNKKSMAIIDSFVSIFDCCSFSCGCLILWNRSYFPLLWLANSISVPDLNVNGGELK
jgi:cytochrome P450